MRTFLASIAARGRRAALWLAMLAVLALGACEGRDRSTGPLLHIEPAGILMTPGQTQRFTVEPPYGTPLWAIDSAGPGVISADGVYQAPLVFPGVRTVTIRAGFDATLSGSLTTEITLIDGVHDSTQCYGASQDHMPGPDEFVLIDSLPEPITRVSPSYPDSARQAGVQGMVRVNAAVCRTGRVSQTIVVQSIPMLDQAAIEAIEQWTFTPATFRTQPVAVWVVIPIVFSLHEPNVTVMLPTGSRR